MQDAKVIVSQNVDHKRFSVLTKKRVRPGCANAKDGLFDCGQGVRTCKGAVFCNFGLFNRIVGAARRPKAASPVKY
jgi:hypothetical protein